MIFYLTYNDVPSGIFSSQVIDVVKFFNTEFKANVKLISFISLRSYFSNRKKIKQEYSDAIVLPMFPGVSNWRFNVFLLSLIVLIMRPHSIIGRSVLATQLALVLRKRNLIKKVIYDGRGAIAAEWKEYRVITHPKMLEEINSLEKDAVLDSDFRISVSNELLTYWKSEFKYQSENHVVIPCTLNNIYENLTISENGIVSFRKLLDFKLGDIVFVYSGSIAGWQSFDLLVDFMKPILSSNIQFKLLFLSDYHEKIIKLQSEFKNQISFKKVKANEVPDYLMAADYGLLIREKSVTNKVASPVKFAEYLACGLMIIISEGMGDYTEFISLNKCGRLSKDLDVISKISLEQKLKIKKLAVNEFRKKHFMFSYQKLLNSLFSQN